MRSSGRRVVVVALNQLYVEDVREAFLPFSYGARRIQAAVAHPPVAECTVALVESTTLDAERTAEEIIALAPDVVGFSTYLWSFATFCDTARILRARLPLCTLVFGGPSARTVMVDHPRFAFVRQLIDAVCVREGEQVFRAIVLASDRTPDGLANIPGLALPRGADVSSGWLLTPSPELVPLDDLPSPHQLGLLPEGIVANLETFRGCPLSCSFCEWGVYEGTNRIFSEEYLTRELEAFTRTSAPGAYLVDAGFSLNRRAFRNLAAAEKSVGFLRDHPLACEVYASNLRDEDAEFLASVNVGRAGVGLQSFNPEVLRAMQRPFDEKKFIRGIELLKQVCDGVAVEIILGLPGDTPEAFKNTVHRAMELEAGSLHIFHALVLPDGLMTRAPEGSDVQYDPVTLKMISCSSWSEKELRDTMEWTARYTENLDGVAEASFWKVPMREGREDHTRHLSVPEIFTDREGRDGRDTRKGTRAVPSASTTGGATSVEGDALHAFGERVITATHGRWRAIEASVSRGTVVVRLRVLQGELLLDLVRHAPGTKCYRVAQGIGVSYRNPPPEFGRDDFARLDATVPALVALAREALGEAATRFALPVV